MYGVDVCNMSANRGSNILRDDPFGVEIVERCELQFKMKQTPRHNIKGVFSPASSKSYVEYLKRLTDQVGFNVQCLITYIPTSNRF